MQDTENLQDRIRLESAAPDLLKALIELIDDLAVPEDGVQADLMKAGRAAIAKALGA